MRECFTGQFRRASKLPRTMSENEAATFEAKLTRLEDIVKVLESPQVTLEASVKLFREGKDLAGACEQLLKEAEGLVNDTGEVDE